MELLTTIVENQVMTLLATIVENQHTLHENRCDEKYSWNMDYSSAGCCCLWHHGSLLTSLLTSNHNHRHALCRTRRLPCTPSGACAEEDAWV